jgi:hypothetical protein
MFFGYVTPGSPVMHPAQWFDSPISGSTPDVICVYQVALEQALPLAASAKGSKVAPGRPLTAPPSGHRAEADTRALFAGAGYQEARYIRLITVVSPKVMTTISPSSILRLFAL